MDPSEKQAAKKMRIRTTEEKTCNVPRKIKDPTVRRIVLSWRLFGVSPESVTWRLTSIR